MKKPLEEAPMFSDVLGNIERALLKDAHKAFTSLDYDLGYDAIKKISSLKIGQLKEDFITCESGIKRIGSLDFAKPIEVRDEDTAIAYIAETLNVLMEELSIRIFPFQSQIIDAIPELIITTDAQGSIKKVNKKFTDCTSYQDEDIIGVHISNLISPNSVNVDLKKDFTVKDAQVDLKIKNNQTIKIKLSIEQVQEYRKSVEGFVFIGQIV